MKRVESVVVNLPEARWMSAPRNGNPKLARDPNVPAVHGILLGSDLRLLAAVLSVTIAAVYGRSQPPGTRRYCF